VSRALLPIAVYQLPIPISRLPIASYYIAMRINKYVASASNLSRRAADRALMTGRVTVNNRHADPGQDVTDADIVTLDGVAIKPVTSTTTIMLNKPAGVVVSRDGQGAQTIYDILPAEYHQLNPVGRLDKYSSGLLLLTNDGQLAHELTHPSRQKTKVYEVFLDKPLQPLHQQMISDHGITLDDGPSKFQIEKLETGNWKLAGEPKQPVASSYLQITLREGRNRQIRRTFEALGYRVTHLHRTHFGPYTLDNLATRQIRQI
jgi:23S rRNA pseudouridine2605 synthase